MKIKYLSKFLLLFFVVSCATVPLTDRKQLRIIPSSQMMAMSFGQYSTYLTENQAKILKGTKEAEMIQRVGSRIQKSVEAYMAQKGLSSRLNGFQWEFNLINDNTVNAWCMPGGKVVFYTGILPICAGETGVAMVMGHEVAHAIAEHGAERMSQQMIAQGIVVGTQVATMNQSPQMQQIYQSVIGAGAQVGLLKYSRVHESEADEMGIMFAAMAGYDPQEAPKIWERMKALGGGKVPEFMSTHPSHDTRINDLNALMPKALELYNQYKGKY
jgi:predicted Zn-dependent protease